MDNSKEVISMKDDGKYMIKLIVAVFLIFGIIIGGAYLCSDPAAASSPPVDKKRVPVDSSGAIEMVPPDEIQRINEEKDRRIAGLESRLTQVERENRELRNKVNDLERRVRALE